MSSDSQIRDRLDRSCHLSLKQYNIIVSYLNTGIKPSAQALQDADLLTKLNGGVNNSGKYYRLRSLAGRLSLRPTDGALVFASNGKVVIPSSKFVQTIKQAHKSEGSKHLNATQTLAKLQETYTIGRRQFGMCEDQIRDVVKSCNQGSCRNSKRKRPSSTSEQVATPAKKSKTEDVKTSKPTNQQNSELIKCLTSVTVPQAPGQNKNTTYLPNKPVIPTTLINISGPTQNNLAVQTGNLQQKLVANNCLLVLSPAAVVVQPSSSLTDLQRFTNCNPTKPVQNNLVLFGGQPQAVSNYNYLIKPSAGSVQSQAPTYTVQPQLGTNVMFLQNITTPASNSIQLVYSSNPMMALPTCPTAASTCPSATSTCPSATSTCPSATSTCLIAPSTTSTETSKDANNLSEVNTFINSFNSSDNINSPICSTDKLLGNSGDLDLARVTDINNNDLDLSWSTDFDLSRQADPSIGEAEEDSATGGSQDPVIIEDSDADSQKEETVPYPNIWHYQEDFTSERCPYRKICIGIQDMRLDLMKSLVGDNVSTERLKKKIVYLHQLVQKQKKATEPSDSD